MSAKHTSWCDGTDRVYLCCECDRRSGRCHMWEIAAETDPDPDLGWCLECEARSQLNLGLICAFCDRVHIWPTLSEDYGGAWLERDGQPHYPRCAAWQKATAAR